MRLEGKTAIITGAGSGIGRVTAQLFSAEGAAVTVVDLDAAAAEETADQVGGRAVRGDVADADLWDRLAASPEPPDVVHLNAGVYGFSGPIEDLPLDVYRNTVAANIDGVVLGVRALVPVMRANGGGSFVVTASVAGLVAFEGNPIYSLTKQAVAGFVRAVAPGLLADGISIDAVCPAIVDTPMTSGALGGIDPAEFGVAMIAPELIASTTLDLATSDRTGRCRAVRADGSIVDFAMPTFRDLAAAT